MTKLICRGTALLALLLVIGIAMRRPAAAQFLCSAGPHDGASCQSDDDCAPSGACVIGQGVCDGGTNDGQPCDCAGGICNAQPVCSSDATMGTCSGGIDATDCCSVDSNCAGSRPCTGTQRVCLAGTNKGFSCLRDAQCPSSLCRSTGKFCNGGDFDGFACVDNADCPSGTCDTPATVVTPSATPTRTPSRTRTPTGAVTPTPSRTVPTPTQGGATPTPTRTSTPTRTVVGTLPPTSTPTPAGVRPTSTPALGKGVVKEAARAGSTFIVVENSTGFPLNGFIKIGTDPALAYTKSGNVLLLSSPLRSNVPAGTPFVVGSGLVVGASQKGGCSMQERGGGSNQFLMFVGIVLACYAIARRR